MEGCVCCRVLLCLLRCYEVYDAMWYVMCYVLVAVTTKTCLTNRLMLSVC